MGYIYQYLKLFVALYWNTVYFPSPFCPCMSCFAFALASFRWNSFYTKHLTNFRIFKYFWDISECKIFRNSKQNSLRQNKKLSDENSTFSWSGDGKSSENQRLREVKLNFQIKCSGSVRLRVKESERNEDCSYELL